MEWLEWKCGDVDCVWACHYIVTDFPLSLFLIFQFCRIVVDHRRCVWVWAELPKVYRACSLKFLLIRHNIHFRWSQVWHWTTMARSSKKMKRIPLMKFHQWSLYKRVNPRNRKRWMSFPFGPSSFQVFPPYFNKLNIPENKWKLIVHIVLTPRCCAHGFHLKIPWLIKLSKDGNFFFPLPPHMPLFKCPILR